MLLKTLPKGLWDVSPWVDTKAFERSINIAPWFIWLVFFCAGLGLSISTAGHAIGHVDVFCVINLPNVKYFWNCTVVILLSLTVLVDVIMAILLLRTRRRARSVLLQVGPARSRSSQHIPRLSSSQVNRPSTNLPPTISIPPSDSAFDRNKSKWSPAQLSGLAVRVVALGTYFIVNAVLEALVISGGMMRERVVVYESTRGIIIFIIFSSQHDIHTVYTSTLLSLLSHLPYSSRFLPASPTSSYQTQQPLNPSRPSCSPKSSSFNDVEKQANTDGSSFNSGSSSNSFFTQRPFVIPGGGGKDGGNKSSSTLAETEEERKGGVKITVEVERFEED
ncbi:hypothetical protein BDY24DRAFT_271944 [Mrakia frigida]|uniref:uncharacterized protein n=1 Tax=Mrakia frigida TaxID=29902 RepID=UPI003FCC063C